jgi:hypothetical protein
VDTPSQECRNNETIFAQFPVDDNQVLACLDLPDGEPFPGATGQDAVWAGNCIKNTVAQPGKLSMFLGYVRPTLARKADYSPARRNRSVCHP